MEICRLSAPSMTLVETMFQEQFAAGQASPRRGIPTDPAQCPISGEYHRYDDLTHAQQFDVRNRFDYGDIDNYLYLICTRGQLTARRRRSSFSATELAVLDQGAQS